jgi:hypothetical protein
VELGVIAACAVAGDGDRMIAKVFILLAKAFIGWGLLCNLAADWCIAEGYRNIDL